MSEYDRKNDAGHQYPHHLVELSKRFCDASARTALHDALIESGYPACAAWHLGTGRRRGFACRDDCDLIHILQGDKGWPSLVVEEENCKVKIARSEASHG